MAEQESSEQTQNAPVIGVGRKEGDQSEPAIPETLPILPLRNLVVFPGTIVPLTIGREASRKLLQESLPQSKVIGIFAQRNPEQENPAPEDLHNVGTAALVLKMIRQSEQSALIVVQGLRRVRLGKTLLTHPFIRAEVEPLASEAPPADDQAWQASVRALRDNAI